MPVVHPCTPASRSKGSFAAAIALESPGFQDPSTLRVSPCRRDVAIARADRQPMAGNPNKGLVSRIPAPIAACPYVTLSRPPSALPGCWRRSAGRPRLRRRWARGSDPQRVGRGLRQPAEPGHTTNDRATPAYHHDHLDRRRTMPLARARNGIGGTDKRLTSAHGSEACARLLRNRSLGAPRDRILRRSVRLTIRAQSHSEARRLNPCRCRRPRLHRTRRSQQKVDAG